METMYQRCLRVDAFDNTKSCARLFNASSNDILTLDARSEKGVCAGALAAATSWAPSTQDQSMPGIMPGSTLAMPIGSIRHWSMRLVGFRRCLPLI